jgi:GNAT superfamily N-acetyltransferase
MRQERKDGYVVTTDPARLDLDVIHGFLRTAYWSTGIPRETVARAVENSIAFGLYGPDGAQCGFARVVSDRATFAYLGDVFVLSDHRGRGLGVWLVECVLGHPELQGLRKWHLATADAHALYRRFGFAPPRAPEAQLFAERSPGELWDVDPK